MAWYQRLFGRYELLLILLLGEVVSHHTLNVASEVRILEEQPFYILCQITRTRLFQAAFDQMGVPIQDGVWLFDLSYKIIEKFFSLSV